MTNKPTDDARPIDDVRRMLHTLRGEAGEELRVIGRHLDVDARFVEALVRALGEISFTEAYDALVREAIVVRRRIIDEGRA